MKIVVSVCSAALRLGAVIVVVGFCGCASNRSVTGKAPVCIVDFRAVPEAKELAEHARRIGNELYPRILVLLLDDTTKAPRQVKVVFTQHAGVPTLMGDESGGYTRGNRIYLGVDWLTNSPDYLDSYLAHEMAHVAQDYKSSKTPAHWMEGIADYVRFKLGYTNGWLCPQCSAQYPHYASGYTCAAAFLLFLETQYGGGLIRQLNAELRRGSYSDLFFVQATGRRLNDLWTDFQKTPAFTPAAAELLQLEESLGYVNGQPPPGVSAEAKMKVLRARGFAIIKEHPGGTLVAGALEFLDDLRDKGRLPGWAKGEKGQVDLMLNTIGTRSDAAYPFSRTFNAKKTGNASVYHYTIVRDSEQSAWKLQKAWRTDAVGRAVEEFTIR
jgi:hypothetical protein